MFKVGEAKYFKNRYRVRLGERGGELENGLVGVFIVGKGIVLMKFFLWIFLVWINDKFI